GRSAATAGFLRYYGDEELPKKKTDNRPTVHTPLLPQRHSGSRHKAQPLWPHRQLQLEDSSIPLHKTQPQVYPETRYPFEEEDYAHPEYDQQEPPNRDFFDQQEQEEEEKEQYEAQHPSDQYGSHQEQYHQQRFWQQNNLHGRGPTKITTSTPPSQLDPLPHNNKSLADAIGGRISVGWDQQDGAMGTPTGPRFDRTLPRNVTVQAGKTAVLACRVMNVADKSVSWIRHDDLHILTVDKYRYSTDQRVSTVYNEVNQEWVLRMRGVTKQDAGMYECQVSTKPILSFIVNMEVVDAVPSTTPFPKLSDEEKQEEPELPKKKVPYASIQNGPEIFVHRGSLINLTCIVTHGTELPVFIYWYHHNKVIDYEGRGGVTVITHTSHDTVSNLLVRDAQPQDSGKYTCKPSNGREDAVSLHVLDVVKDEPRDPPTSAPPKSVS
ncbi:unnamed protein product, partial [Meganyctiphanes norvegica]